jgi:hypothetical protein
VVHLGRGEGPVSIPIAEVGARLAADGSVRVIEDFGDGRFVFEVTEDGVPFIVVMNSHGTTVCQCGRAANRGRCHHQAAARMYLEQRR